MYLDPRVMAAAPTGKVDGSHSQRKWEAVLLSAKRSPYVSFTADLAGCHFTQKPAKGERSWSLAVTHAEDKSSHLALWLAEHLKVLDARLLESHKHAGGCHGHPSLCAGPNRSLGVSKIRSREYFSHFSCRCPALITKEAKVLLNYCLFSNYGCQQGPISAGWSAIEQTYNILTPCSVLRLSDIMLKRKPGCSYYYRLLQQDRLKPCHFILHTSSLLE